MKQCFYKSFKWREDSPHLDVFSLQGEYYSFCCILCNSNYPNNRSKFCSENEFTTWHKISPWNKDHENSPVYRCTFLTWKELERGLNKGALIDNHLLQQIAKARSSGMYHWDSSDFPSIEFAPSFHHDTLARYTNPENFL